MQFRVVIGVSEYHFYIRRLQHAHIPLEVSNKYTRETVMRRDWLSFHLSVPTIVPTAVHLFLWQHNTHAQVIRLVGIWPSTGDDGISRVDKVCRPVSALYSQFLLC